MIKQRTRRIGWVIGVAACMAALSAGAVFAQTRALPMAGDQKAIWLIDPEQDQFSLYYMPAARPEAGLIRRQPAIRGAVHDHGMAATNGTLWLAYTGGAVQSVTPVVNEQLGTLDFTLTFADQSLPEGVMVHSLAAGEDGPWALVRVENAAALEKLEQATKPEQAGSADAEQAEGNAGDDSAAGGDGAAEDGAEADTPGGDEEATTRDDGADTGPAGDETSEDEASSADGASAASPPVEPYEPQDRLLRLKDGTWHTVALPEDWPRPVKRGWAVMVSPGDAAPVLLVDQPAEADAPAKLQVFWPRQENGTLKWDARSYDVRGEAPAEAHVVPFAVDRQLVVGVVTEGEKALDASIKVLRPEADAAAPREVGMLTLSSGKVPPRWGLAAYGRRVAMIAGDPADRLIWASTDLAGLKVEGQDVLERIEPDFFGQAAGQYVFFGVLVVSTLLMFVFWRRGTKQEKVVLPRDSVIADLSSRGIAGLIDLGPWVLLASVLSSTSLPLMYEHHPMAALGWNDMWPYLMAVGVYILYGALAEAFYGKTLGKAAMGLRVCSVDGQPPDLWQAIFRNLVKFLDLTAFPLLVLPMLSPFRQRLGDLVSRTIVVGPTKEEDRKEQEDDEE